jgi:hypothetical protein
MRQLTASEVKAISDWLAQHRQRWTINVATSPAPTVLISLQTARQETALTLSLWLGPKYPSWNHAVIVEYARKFILIQSFNDRELAPFLRLFAGEAGDL